MRSRANAGIHATPPRSTTSATERRNCARSFLTDGSRNVGPYVVSMNTASTSGAGCGPAKSGDRSLPTSPENNTRRFLSPTRTSNSTLADPGMWPASRRVTDTPGATSAGFPYPTRRHKATIDATSSSVHRRQGVTSTAGSCRSKRAARSSNDNRADSRFFWAIALRYGQPACQWTVTGRWPVRARS